MSATPQARSLRLLSAGAALGVVNALAAGFRDETGCVLEPTFGAVGAIADKLLAGEAADLIILTRPMLDKLAREGRVRADSVADIGAVPTGVAVRDADPSPEVSSAESLGAALLAAQGIYFPDPEKATAGIHFSGVIDRLGIRARVADRLRTWPNGATAMRELAQARGERLIGVTQVTEIRYTEGVRLAGLLPKAFELSTMYSIGAVARAPVEALRFIEAITGSGSRDLRSRAGFIQEPVAK